MKIQNNIQQQLVLTNRKKRIKWPLIDWIELIESTNPNMRQIVNTHYFVAESDLIFFSVWLPPPIFYFWTSSSPSSLKRIIRSNVFCLCLCVYIMYLWRKKNKPADNMTTTTTTNWIYDVFRVFPCCWCLSFFVFFLSRQSHFIWFLCYQTEKSQKSWFVLEFFFSLLLSMFLCFTFHFVSRTNQNSKSNLCIEQ